VNALRVLGRAAAKFHRDNGLFLASGIAFQVILSLVPLALLVLSFAGTYLVSHERAMAQFASYLEQAAPTLDAAHRASVIAVVEDRGTIGVVGTAGLLWIATTVFGWLRTALNAIFGVPRPHGTVRGMLLDLAMIVLSGCAFLASTVLTGFAEYLRRAPALFPAVRERLTGASLSYLVPFAVILAICFLIYYLVPNRRGSARAALAGALVAGVLWEAAKHLFAWYVAASGNYSLVYGSLSAAAALLVWTYYSAAVLLFGAEVASVLESSST
jgi:membrane protein